MCLVNKTKNTLWLINDQTVIYYFYFLVLNMGTKIIFRGHEVIIRKEK